MRLQSDDLKRIHGTDERISSEDYNKVVSFYAQFIWNEGPIK
jgi:acetylornithine deacetylase/succinyl-diaminopimelate desuccinylase-like protein